jgi:hypothetical protein
MHRGGSGRVGVVVGLWSPVPGQPVRHVTADDAEPEVGHLGRFGHADPFQLDVGAARMLVKAYLIAERDGGDVDQDLV